MKNNISKRPNGSLYSIMYYALQMLILLMVVLGILFLRNLNVEDIINYTPDNKFLASIIIILLYGLKSITLVIPLVLLYASTSLLFTTTAALFINSIGIIVCSSIPYFIGRFSGQEFTRKIVSKYPNAKKIYAINEHKEFIGIFTIKILGVLPNDISSLLIGSMNISYKKFLLASILAKSPIMIIVTLMSSEEISPKSPEFVLMLVLFAIIVFVTTFINRRYFSKKNNSKDQ